MNAKPEISRKLYLNWALAGAILGALTLAWIVETLLTPGENDPNVMDALLGCFCWTLFSLIPGALIGALLGIIAGRIGYAIKPRKGL